MPAGLTHGYLITRAKGPIRIGWLTRGHRVYWSCVLMLIRNAIKWFSWIILLVSTGGCAGVLPPVETIPKNTPPEVQKSIRMFYGGANARERGCRQIAKLARDGTDFSAAVPWLIILLDDSETTYRFSMYYWILEGWPWFKDDLGPGFAAQQALQDIGEPAVPALSKAARTSPSENRREIASLLIKQIHERSSTSSESPPSFLYKNGRWIPVEQTGGSNGPTSRPSG